MSNGGVNVASDALVLELGKRRIPLTPSEGFALAERLIRGATKAIVQDEADRAALRCVLRDAADPEWRTN